MRSSRRLHAQTQRPTYDPGMQTSHLRMPLGVYAALLGALLCALGLTVPLPFGPEAIPGGRQPAAGAPAECLELSYRGAPDQAPLPSQMRLRGVERFSDGSWFQADGGPGQELFNQAWWRPAGPDSVDIAWHHSPILRLQARGDTLRGRAIPHLVAPLIVMLEMHDWSVTAVRSPCEQFKSPAT